MPDPIYTPNQLIVGDGHVAVVTGWTVKEFVATKLNKHEYAVIGQLYSAARGIDFLVRNLLWLNHVTHLVIINATKEDRNSGSCQCLTDFFVNGVGSGNVINSPVEGYIDTEIPLAALEVLRQSLTVKTVYSVKEAVETVRYFANQSVASAREPMKFPKIDRQIKAVSGEVFGHRIEGKTLAETWLKILHRIRMSGIVRKTAYDSLWQEVIDLVAVVNPSDDDLPDYLPVSAEFLENYVNQVVDDAPVRDGVKYTYGQRLRSHFGVDQVEAAIATLSANPDSSRAVLTLWDATIDNQDGSSPPCLNHVWFRVIDNCLTLTATFRSNDMFAAWCANVIGLQALQKYVANALNLPCGKLITISQSAHIYDDCWENADKVIKEHYYAMAKKQSYDDPVGSFVIEIEDRRVVVNHLLPHDGLILEKITAHSVKDAITQLASQFPSILPYHAMYLGSEVQKAFDGVKLGKEYKQS